MTVPDPNANLDRLMDLVGPRVGLIRDVCRVQRGIDEPSPPVICQATLSHFDHRMAPAQDRRCAGKGATEREAMAGAVGEALERYCAQHVDIQAIRRLAWNEAGLDAVAPPAAVLYSDRQYAQRDFPHPRWDRAEPIAWLSVRELPQDRDVLMPAVFVHLTTAGLRPADVFTPPTSSGLAAGPDLERAILAGLVELAERDAFVITWMARLPAPEVDFAAERGLARAIFVHYAKFGVDLRVFRLCTDLPLHPMLAIALDRTGKGPAAIAALGCHADPTLALRKALLEICQVLPGEKRRYREHNPAGRLKTPGDVRTLEDHSGYLSVPERIGEFAFLLKNGQLVQLEDLIDHSTGSVSGDLDRLVGALRRCGCRVLYADLTTSDLRAYPVRAVRIVATGLQPIHFGHGEERLGGARLFELPKKLGLAGTTLCESDLNPCPHPLA